VINGRIVENNRPIFLNHTYKKVVADELYLFQSGFSLQEEELRRMASAHLATQFGFHLVLRDGKCDKENPYHTPSKRAEIGRLCQLLGNWDLSQLTSNRVTVFLPPEPVDRSI
jgi:hypothetical protein